MPISMISPMMDEIGASTGGGTPSGRAPETSWSFSLTICRAWKTSVPQSNSTQTMLIPCEVAERTRELEAANTDKDRMLIALGHDLRSPLAALTQLEDLDLSFTRFAEPGLEVITKLIGLKRLGLEQTSITDTGMAWVAQLPKLEALGLKLQPGTLPTVTVKASSQRRAVVPARRTASSRPCHTAR